MSGQELAPNQPPQVEQLTLFDDFNLSALPAAGGWDLLKKGGRRPDVQAVRTGVHL
ncbi:hypothetical protein ACFTAO_49430 [Paenibacillus rhizoplanae]